jgi:cell division protein FtsZ
MYEVDEAARIITESIDSDANIIFGATINEHYTGEIKITVVATGFDEDTNSKFRETGVAASKANPFGKKSINEPKPMTTQSPVRPATPATPAEDYDVPAFLRKKI